MSRPRIVSLTPHPVERDSRTFKIAAAAARLGYDSVVVEGGRSEWHRRALPFTLQETETSVSSAATKLGARVRRRLPRLPKWVLTIGGYVLLPLHLIAGWRTSALYLPPAELYYLHSFKQFPALWLANRSRRAPFVYDAHDMYSVLRYDGRERPLRVRVEERFYDILDHRCVRHAAAFVTVSDGVADLYAQQYGRRPVVLRNAHDSRLDEPTTMNIRASCGLDSETFLLALSGNFKRGMGLEALFQALAELPETVHLALVGAGYAAIDQDIQRFRLDGRVHVLAPVPPTRIVPFLRSADLAPIVYRPLNPNLRNALPNGFFHAVAAHLPILYPADLPEVRAIAETHRFGLAVPRWDHASVVAALRRLATDRGELARLREATAQASEAISWEREEPILEEVLRNALAGLGAW